MSSEHKLRDVIIEQAVELNELRKRVARMGEAIQDARNHMICVGGPLNDNKLQYSREQLVTFGCIDELLEPWDVRCG